VDIIFKGRHTDVLDRFRRHATAKLAKIGKLDQKAIRIDVEVSTERNPRQSGRRERVELTISSRGPTIRAEAAPQDDERPVSSAVADEAEDVVPIPMQGDGPLVVRQKYHCARPMAIDQALFEMELVGHDFFLYRDAEDGLPSVVYRRRGYQYGVIRLVEEMTDEREGQTPGLAELSRANGRAAKAATIPAR
jgi:ribosomal subunit interface protein